MGKETVLIVDGGGRGSALVDKYGQSDHVGRLIAVPGNDLMKINTEKSVQTYPELKTTSVNEIVDICVQEGVGLVDVAQERAIEAGLVNALNKKGIPVVGPTREAGRLEWDKAWAREFTLRQQVGHQPAFMIFSREERECAIELMDKLPNIPRFIKAAYLADGKGAKSARNREEAKEKIMEISETEAGRYFLIEDWLEGDHGRPSEEFSFFVVTDGEHYRTLGNAQDYKRANNFDQGENTGSMGCNSPTSLITDELSKDIKKNIIEKILTGLKEKGYPYKGVLYLGGMAVSKEGKYRPLYEGFEYNLKPYIIEFNARWGDPEAQVILPGLKTDLFELGKAVAEGDIRKVKIEHDKKVRVVITGAAKGYPDENIYQYAKFKRIHGLDEARKIEGIKIYSAAIKEIDNKYYAYGGRLFYIVGEGDNIIQARRNAYEAMSLIHIKYNHLQYRTDIGWRDVERLNSSLFEQRRIPSTFF